MDETTVPTPAEPRQPHAVEDSHTIQHLSIKTSRHVTASIPAAGLEVVTVLPDEPIPDYLHNVRYRAPIHEDGSLCALDCGCITPESLTTLPMEEAVTIGDWGWYAGPEALSGVRRTGPSDAEQVLEARVDQLAEDLAGEKILHDLTRDDMAALARRSGERRSALRATVRRYRAEVRRRVRRACATEAAIAAACVTSMAAAILWDPVALLVTGAAVAVHIIREWTR